MMTKPPGLTPTSFPPDELEDEESIDDSLEDILTGANEKAFESAEAAAPADSAAPRAPNEVTQITARPPVTDDVVEEETKVEQAEKLLKAAAARDAEAPALTAQASEQRDRALRKGASNGHVASASSDSEFEDPDDELSDDGSGDSADPFDAGSLTPADIPISDDEAPPLAPNGGGSGSYVATPSSGPPSQPRLPPPGRILGTPPPGRPDAYTRARLPTPSSAEMPAVSGYGTGSGAHYPSIAIPAPSTASTPVAVRPAEDNKIHLPARGLAAVLGAAFAGGLLVGALLWKHSSPSSAELAAVEAKIEAAKAEAKAEAAKVEAKTEAAKAEVKPIAPATAPVIEPVKPAVAAAKATTTVTPTTTTAVAAPTEAAAEPAPAPRPVHRAAAPAAPKVKKVASSDLDAPAKPAATRPAKKKVVWQDPFAQ